MRAPARRDRRRENCEPSSTPGRYGPTVDDDPVEIRPAATEDLHQLNELYNHYVLYSHVTFDVRPVTMAERVEWFRHYRETGPHRVLVAVAGSEVLGFASSSPDRPREAYETSVETTVYLAEGLGKQGLGSRLYEELFRRLKGQGIHAAIGGIALPNYASVALHEKFGMRKVAHFEQVGFKFGKWVDVAYWERIL